MTVVQLRKALEQFAPNSLVVFWDGQDEAYMTPYTLHKVDDNDVELRCRYATDERETNP